MNCAHILELHDDCLYHIFKYLEAEDRLQFAHVCGRFKNIFISQVGKKYRDYNLNLKCERLELLEFSMCREVVERLIIDMAYYEEHVLFPIQIPNKLLNILLGSLQDMRNMHYLIARDNAFRNEAIEKPFDQILASVAGLNNLKGLEIHAVQQEVSVENLSQLHHLEELELNILQMGAPTLVKCCKSNPNLRVLHLRYGCIKKNLHHIVPHCKNLEVLNFGMTADAPDYAPLAKLPKLRELTHSGIRKSGSFQPLLKALAAKSQLERLVISGVSVNVQEVEQIVQINSLTQLKCFCFTIECVEMLANLSNLRELCLWMSTHEDVSKALLKIIINCTNLKKLSLTAGNVQKDFIAKIQELKVGRMLKVDLPFLETKSEETDSTVIQQQYWSAF